VSFGEGQLAERPVEVKATESGELLRRRNVFRGSWDGVFTRVG
jgi:hypothetical protein